MQQCDRGLKMGHLWCLAGSKRRRKENGSSGMWGLPLVSGDKALTFGCLVIEKGSTDSTTDGAPLVLGWIEEKKKKEWKQRDVRSAIGFR
ncbi:unnamed protein product [Lactuca virosa]|uniref:Uncharacterized protein n=1 Tax=Lactuca virosa TaxID=75947 RepID=A0AAU9MF95_9ASTR|nr:unnamed protein product [Lactuca virosa]